MENELQKRIEKLERDLIDLTDEVYRTNFSAQQDFNKSSSFTTRLKIPVYTTAPTTCDVGEIVALTSGTYYACKATNTWTKFI
jgi:hypothetical protein